MDIYLTDLFIMWMNNTKHLREARSRYVEEAVEGNEDEKVQVRVLEEYLRQLYETMMIRTEKPISFHNDIVSAVKGKIDFFNLARNYVEEYKNEGGG